MMDPNENPIETRRKDLVDFIVKQGHGIIAAGMGMVLVYGPTLPDSAGGRFIFIPNTIVGLEADKMIREALLLPRQIVRPPKNKTAPVDLDITPTEE